MRRAKIFDSNRDMAQVEFDQFQQELKLLRDTLNDREQQIIQLEQQSQGQVSQMEQQLAEVMLRLEEREQEIGQLRVRVSDLPSEPIRNHNNEFVQGRVPDIIKGLPQYSGNPRQLSTWIQSVERILNHFRDMRHTDIYLLWVQEIRNKVVGEAGDMLSSNGVALDWSAIRAQLTLLYGDKRELSTLLQKLFSLRQGGLHVNEFYSNVRDCFTGISTHIQTNSEWENPTELVKFIDKLCLEKFVDGLEEPYTTHVSLLQPITLNQAYQYATEKANKIARKTGVYDIGKTLNKPPVPPRSVPSFNQFPKAYSPNSVNRPFPNQIGGPMHIPQLNRPMYNAHQSRPMQFPQFNRPPNAVQGFPFRTTPYQFRPNFPLNAFQPKNLPQVPPKPLPKPEMMEVDPSIKINYMNRPKPMASYQPRPSHFGNFNFNEQDALDCLHQQDEIYDPLNSYCFDADDYVYTCEDNSLATEKPDEQANTTSDKGPDDLNFSIATYLPTIT